MSTIFVIAQELYDRHGTRLDAIPAHYRRIDGQFVDDVSEAVVYTTLFATVEDLPKDTTFYRYSVFELNLNTFEVLRIYDDDLHLYMNI